MCVDNKPLVCELSVVVNFFVKWLIIGLIIRYIKICNGLRELGEF